MQLHQRITSLVTKETDRLLKEFLNDNPDLLKRYVEHGMTALGVVLSPVNAFMRHLLVIQGLDPDTNPGDRQRQQLLEAVGTLFERNHQKDFDDDYDFSWVQKKFDETRSNMKQLSISKNDFKKMTDISNWGSSRYPTVVEEQEYFMSKPSTKLPDNEIRVTPEEIEKNFPNLPPDLGTAEGRQEYRQRMVSETSEPITVQDLRDSLKQIIKETADKAALASKFDPGDAIKKVEGIFEEIAKLGANKKGIKTSKKKVNKGPDPKGSPAWGSKQPRVRRVPSTEPVQEEPSTLRVESDRKLREPSRDSRPAARNLSNLAQAKKAQAKAAKEATPEFQAEMKVKLERATELTNLMVNKGLCEVDDKSRQNQIQSMLSWTDNNFDALERVITKYGPTKDAVAENKFKGSFRRVQK